MFLLENLPIPGSGDFGKYIYTPNKITIYQKLFKKQHFCEHICLSKLIFFCFFALFGQEEIKRKKCVRKVVVARSTLSDKQKPKMAAKNRDVYFPKFDPTPPPVEYVKE